MSQIGNLASNEFSRNTRREMRGPPGKTQERQDLIFVSGRRLC
jgi:hypothetical protein